MSSPAPGNYYIVSRASFVASDTTKLLAINFNGILIPLNVTRLDDLPTQVWVLTVWKDKRVLSPKLAPNNHVGMGKHFTDVWVINAHPDPPSCWYIKDSGTGAYTIQNGDLTGYWSLKNIDHGATISFGERTCALNGEWLLLPADK